MAYEMAMRELAHHETSGLLQPTSDLDLDRLDKIVPALHAHTLEVKTKDSLMALQTANILLSDNEISARVQAQARESNGELHQLLTVTTNDIARYKAVMAKHQAARRPAVHSPAENPSFDRRRLQPPSADVATATDDTHNPPPPPNPDTPFGPPTLIDWIIVNRGLEENPEQRRALLILHHHFDLTSALGEQLLHYIAGVGGTGKSHLISCMVEYLEMRESMNKVLVSAPTGIAAVLIRGYTIHALSFLPTGSEYTVLANIRRAELAEIWGSVKYLIIDEISMMPATMMHHLSKRLQDAKQGTTDASKPFGGVNVIVLGDMGQLPPVQALSMYNASLVKKVSSQVGATKNMTAAVYGAYLWQQFRKVTVLRQGVRHNGDTQYAELLSRVRLGKATEFGPTNTASGSDYATLNSRLLSVMAWNSSFNAERFENCPILVGDRKTRDQINLRAAYTRALKAGQVLKFVHSKDKLSRGAPYLVGAQARLTHSLCSDPKKLLGALPYYRGMKVMITENLDMAHGVVNGAEGIVEQMVTERGADGVEYVVCAFVRVTNVGQVVEGLPIDIVPIFPVSSSESFVSDVTGATINFTRRQLPLVPAFAYTDYKSQGRTLDSAIVDIASVNKTQGAYVMLSRVRTMAGLAILRPFPIRKIACGLPHNLRAEFQRLDACDRMTDQWFREKESQPIMAGVSVYSDELDMGHGSGGASGSHAGGMQPA